MENSAIDLSLVKREPGLEDMYSSDPVIFDGMIGLGEDFNDSFHSSVVRHNLDTLWNVYITQFSLLNMCNINCSIFQEE